MSSTVRRLYKAAVLIAAITVLSRIIGFGRVLVFARTVGSNCVGSTYQSANTVPNILFEIAAGGALASLVVPLLAGSVASADREILRRAASALLTWTVLILTPIAVLAALFARPIMTGLLGGSTCDGAVDLGTRMLVVFAPQVILYGVGIVCTGILQAHERFIGPAMAPVLSSLVVLFAYVVYRIQVPISTPISQLSEAQELTLSLGTTLGVVVLTLSLLIPLKRLGIRLAFAVRFPTGMAKQARRLAGAGVAALAAQQLSVAVVVWLANSQVPGSTYVVYTFAWTVFLVPWAVVAVPLATSAFPRMASSVASGDEDGFRTTAAGAGRAVMMTTLVGAAGLIAAARPIARVLEQGVGNVADISALQRGIIFFAPGLVGYGLVALLSRALYARGDARTPAVCQVSGWLTVIGADLVFSQVFPAHDRVIALALGNTVGMTVAGLLLIVALGRSAGVLAVAGLAKACASGLAAAGLAGVAGWTVAAMWDSGGAVAAVLQTVAVGVTVLAVAGAVLLRTAGDELGRLVRRGRVPSQEVTP